MCTEMLFAPQIAGINCAGFQDHISGSLFKVDSELTETMLSNIVIAGGNTLFTGFGRRLWDELNKLNVSESRIKIFADPGRLDSVWRGGSILSALSTFQTMWVTKAEYDEFGPSIIHRKCL